MISVHGLIRSQHRQLGGDVDSGSQATDLVELARAWAKHFGSRAFLPGCRPKPKIKHIGAK